MVKLQAKSTILPTLIKYITVLQFPGWKENVRAYLTLQTRKSMLFSEFMSNSRNSKKIIIVKFNNFKAKERLKEQRLFLIL